MKLKPRVGLDGSIGSIDQLSPIYNTASISSPVTMDSPTFAANHWAAFSPMEHKLTNRKVKSASNGIETMERMLTYPNDTPTPQSSLQSMNSSPENKSTTSHHNSSFKSKFKQLVKDNPTIAVILVPFFIHYLWQVKQVIFDVVFWLLLINFIVFIYYQAWTNLVKVDLVGDFVNNVKYNWNCLNRGLGMGLGLVVGKSEEMERNVEEQLQELLLLLGNLDPELQKKLLLLLLLLMMMNREPQLNQKLQISLLLHRPLLRHLPSYHPQAAWADRYQDSKELMRLPPPVASTSYINGNDLETPGLVNQNYTYLRNHHKHNSSTSTTVFSPRHSLDSSTLSSPSSDYFKLKQFKLKKDAMISPFPLNLSESVNDISLDTIDHELNKLKMNQNQILPNSNLDLFHHQSINFQANNSTANNNTTTTTTFSPSSKNPLDNKISFSPTLFKSKSMPIKNYNNSNTNFHPRSQKVLRFAPNVSMNRPRSNSNNFTNDNLQSNPNLINPITSFPTLDPKSTSTTTFNHEVITSDPTFSDPESCSSSTTSLFDINFDEEVKSKIVTTLGPSIIELTRNFYHQITGVLKNYKSIKLVQEKYHRTVEMYNFIKSSPNLMMTIMLNYATMILPNFVVKMILFHYICFELFISLVKLPFVMLGKLAYNISGILFNVGVVLPMTMAYKSMVKFIV